MVMKGVWSVDGKEREVAVKSLADGSTEEKRIQFLQEAAIMSQFKHPNVITLHAVLMDHEPVRVRTQYIMSIVGIHIVHLTQLMLIVEMMTMGNLKEYLILTRPRYI